MIHLSPCHFRIRFCQLIFYQNFLEVKIGINRVILIAYWVFLKLPLGGAKDEHFSFFQRSCQLGLSLGHLSLYISEECTMVRRNFEHLLFFEPITGQIHLKFLPQFRPLGFLKIDWTKLPVQKSTVQNIRKLT